MRTGFKAALRFVALLAVVPALVSFWLRSLLVGRDRALVGSSQVLSLIPGLTGQYLRRAFLARTLAYCGPNAVIEFGVLFSQTGCRIDDYAYIGPRCSLGLVHIEAHVMLATGVQIPSGPNTHGTSTAAIMRDQQGSPRQVTIGHGAWIGSNAVVMANVGHDSIVGAGAVVTHQVPAMVVAGGVPARVIKQRDAEPPQT